MELQIEVLTTPDTYENEAKGGAYMDRDLAEWARAFSWDARRTITQTYKERISQSMGFADQFREGFTREQFTNYLNTIEAQASFILSGEDDVQTPLIQSIPHSPDLSGSMPTYTLSPDNLLALLETQRGQSELCQQVNVWTQRHTGGVQGPQRYQDNPNARHHEMFAPLIIGKGDGQYEHITMALLDSGNLLQQPAINASLHQTLGVKVDKTNVVARGANQLSIDIEGISKGIYLKFPNLQTSFLVRPLVVKNLASPLNLGSKFNFEFMLTPQLVEQDVNT